MSLPPPAKRLKMGDPFYSEVYLFAQGLITRESAIQNGKKVMKASCKHCTKTWCLTNKRDFSTTSNYRRHYGKYHSEIQIDDDVTEEEGAVQTKAEALTKLKQSSLTIFTQLQKPEQNVISSYMRNKHEPFDHKIFIKLLINFIISCNLPINTSDAPSFRTLITYCIAEAPRITSKRLLHSMIDSFQASGDALKIKLQEHIKDGSSIALTNDIWQSATGTSYLAITAHWIDNDWITHGRLLTFVGVPASHSSPNIFKVIKASTKRFGIHKHIIAITTDSADPNRVACNLFEKWLAKLATRGDDVEESEKEKDNIKASPLFFSSKRGWCSCLAHGANRSVQDMLNTLKVSAPATQDKQELLYSQVTEHTFMGNSSHESSMKKLRRIVVKYKRSGEFREAFDKQCLIYEIKPQALTLDMEASLNPYPPMTSSTNTLIGSLVFYW